MVTKVGTVEKLGGFDPDERFRMDPQRPNG